MKKTSLKSVAEKMKDLDFCMLVTRDARGKFYSRPMSNNGKVEYDGNSWFFSYSDSNKIKQIEKDPKVTLIYQTDKMLFIHCYGHAKIITQKKILMEKWVDSLKMWFPKGVDTPGICLIKVEAKNITFWHKEEEGEYKPN